MPPEELNRLLSLREVSFEEPEVLVHFAGQRREKVGCNGIIQIIGILYCPAQRVGMMGDVVYEKLEHGRTVRGGQVGLLKARLGCDFACRSIGDTTERRDTFRDRVGLMESKSS